MNNFRSFIAYTLPEEIIELCTKIQSQLLKNKDIFRLVKPSNMHLTVLFLGNKTMEELNSIKDSLSGIGSKVKGISLTTFGISTFGRPPSVVYLEIIDKEKKGKFLAEEICNRLKAKPDKSWAAHITLARIRSYNKKFNVFHPKNIKFEPIVFSPTSVTIFTSELTPKGPNYTVFYVLVEN